MNDKHPKVFISHAGEDKERFVKKFSTLLRENGVDAWTSFWEINDGDSLVKKIFDEGIEGSSQFIVILSQYSINKPWVRKELDIAIVKQIEEQYKIIPILLDNVIIPTSLKETAYKRIKDLENIEEDAKEIINSVFKLYDKPPLGKVPVFADEKIFQLPNLPKIDNIIFNLCFDILAEWDQYPYSLDYGKLMTITKDKGIEENYLDGDIGHGNGRQILIYPKLTTFGFQEIAQLKIKDYNNLVKEIAIDIYNVLSNNEYDSLTSITIADKYNLPQSYARYFVKIIEEEKLCEITEAIGCIIIKRITPKMKRWIENPQ